MFEISRAEFKAVLLHSWSSHYHNTISPISSVQDIEFENGTFEIGLRYLQFCIAAERPVQWQGVARPHYLETLG